MRSSSPGSRDQQAAGSCLRVVVASLAHEVVGALRGDGAPDRGVHQLDVELVEALEDLGADVEERGGVKEPREQDQDHRVGSHRGVAQPLDRGSVLAHVHGVDRREVAGGQHRGGGDVVAGGEEQVERRGHEPEVPVPGGGATHRLWVRTRERGEELADRPGEVPPAVVGRVEGRARGEHALEEARPDGGVDDVGVEEGESRDLREPCTPARVETGDGLVEDRGDRAEAGALGGVLGEVQHALAGPLRTGRGEHRRGGPPTRRPVDRERGVLVDVEAEPDAAQPERLVAREGEVRRGELQGVGTTQALGARRQAAAEHDEPLVVAEPRGHAVEQEPGVAVRVVGVVDHERAGLADERGEHHVDGAHEVLGRGRGVVGGLGEPRRRDRRAKARHEHPGGHPALVEGDLHAHEPPGVHELRGEDGLAEATGRLDHDHPVLEAPRGEPGPRHVMRWQAPHPRPPGPSPASTGALRRQVYGAAPEAPFV